MRCKKLHVHASTFTETYTKHMDGKTNEIYLFLFIVVVGSAAIALDRLQSTVYIMSYPDSPKRGE